MLNRTSQARVRHVHPRSDKVQPWKILALKSIQLLDSNITPTHMTQCCSIAS
jgi:hypothetical protein